MTHSNSFAARLAYNQIDPSVGQLLRRNKNFIMQELPGILDRFYDHVSKYPETASFFGSREHMNRAKDAQIRHWATIMDGTFDANYEESIRRIGETHHRIGLDPRWYIGGYNALISGLIGTIASKRQTGADKRAYFGSKDDASRGSEEVTSLQIAISRVALLDMDLAISVYLDAGRRDLAALAKNVVDMSEVVSATVNDLKGGAAQMSGTAKKSLDQVSAVAAAAEQASTNVRTVAAAADQLSASVREISRQVSTSSQIAERAVATANTASARVKELTLASSEIGSVVDLISNIARQTNLLALNATIEAARAGEAGKGFAVVAQEVKSLASQTARATADIGSKIHAIQGATSDAVAAISEVSTIIGSISGISATIASAVEQQGAATIDIAQNVQEAAQGTAEVASNATGLTAAASATERAAESISLSSTDLGAKADQLKMLAEGFMKKSRAA